ncbi:hypothetical protein C8Q80DRAFT_1121795 [Daedaleopsis nitida]|nr:hypothetical protein C8Q80DRAFT_1121795 [Daedaleopsis nitida]
MIAPKFIILATLVSAACVGINARPVNVDAGNVDTVRHRPYPSSPSYPSNPHYPTYSAYPRDEVEATVTTQTVSTSVPSTVPQMPSLATMMTPPAASLSVPTTGRLSTTSPMVTTTNIPSDSAIPTAGVSSASPPAATAYIPSGPIRLASESFPAVSDTTSSAFASDTSMPAIPTGLKATTVSAPSQHVPSTTALQSTSSVDVDVPTPSTPTPTYRILPTNWHPQGAPVVTTQVPSHLGAGTELSPTSTSDEPQPTSDEPQPTDDAPPDWDSDAGSDPYEDGGWTPDSDPEDPEDSPSEDDQNSGSGDLPEVDVGNPSGLQQ